MTRKLPSEESEPKACDIEKTDCLFRQNRHLIEKTEEWQSAFDIVNDAIWIMNHDQQILRANKAAEILFGCHAPEIVGKKCWEVAHGTSAPVAGCPNLRTIESLKRETMELYIGEGCFQVTVDPIIDAGSNYIGSVHIVRDITKLKQAEAALKEKDSMLANIAGQVPGMLFQVMLKPDGSYSVPYSSIGVLNIFGCLPEEIKGDFSPIANVINPDDRKKIALKFEKSAENLSLWKCEYRVNIPGEPEKWVWGNAIPERLDDGSIIWSGYNMDITEHKMREEELIKTQKLESLGLLAGGIAHDFNNILTAILGNVALARDQLVISDTSDEIHEMLGNAETAAKRARTLTRQLLTFSKGGIPVKKTTAIKDIIRESSLFVTSGAKSRCNFSIDNDLWPVEVDEGQISQVINNIVINASQAMPDGGIIYIKAENRTIERINKLKLKPGRYVKISVHDEGTGVPEEFLGKIFDPYFTTKEDGSGLGLATSYSIIKKHNGIISASSFFGAGTTFTVYLPASANLSQESEEPVPVKGNGKILVMDDEEPLRRILDKMLVKLGYEPGFAQNGSEAVAMYKTAEMSGKRYDAVILDLTVPGGTGGIETLELLKKLNPDVRAIVSSGYSEGHVLANYSEYGFRGMIAKPFETVSLSRVLNDVLT